MFWKAHPANKQSVCARCCPQESATTAQEMEGAHWPGAGEALANRHRLGRGVMP